jgi:hypothetical protein
MKNEIVVELEPEHAEALARALRAENVEVDGPDQIDSLDGITIAAIIIVVTPVVATAVVRIIKAIKGSRGVIRAGDKVIDLQNFTDEEINALIGPQKK